MSVDNCSSETIIDNFTKFYQLLQILLFIVVLRHEYSNVTECESAK